MLTILSLECAGRYKEAWDSIQDTPNVLLVRARLLRKTGYYSRAYEYAEQALQEPDVYERSRCIIEMGEIASASPNKETTAVVRDMLFTIGHMDPLYYEASLVRSKLSNRDTSIQINSIKKRCPRLKIECMVQQAVNMYTHHRKMADDYIVEALEAMGVTIRGNVIERGVVHYDHVSHVVSLLLLRAKLHKFNLYIPRSHIRAAKETLRAHGSHHAIEFANICTAEALCYRDRHIRATLLQAAYSWVSKAMLLEDDFSHKVVNIQLLLVSEYIDMGLTANASAILNVLSNVVAKPSRINDTWHISVCTLVGSYMCQTGKHIVGVEILQKTMDRGDQQTRLRCLNGIASSYSARQNWPLAVQHFDLAANLSRSINTIADRQTKLFISHYVHALVQNGNIMRARHVIDDLISDYPQDEELKRIKSDLIPSMSICESVWYWCCS